MQITLSPSDVEGLKSPEPVSTRVADLVRELNQYDLIRALCGDLEDALTASTMGGYAKQHYANIISRLAHDCVEIEAELRREADEADWNETHPSEGGV